MGTYVTQYEAAPTVVWLRRNIRRAPEGRDADLERRMPMVRRHSGRDQDAA